MAKSTHVHRLKKHKYATGNTIFFCTLPDCHYKIEAALALGKRTICNICGDEFIIGEYTLKLIRPHCDKCGKVKVKDVNGEVRYVRKASNKVLSNVAVETAQDLRSRLDTATRQSQDDDI